MSASDLEFFDFGGGLNADALRGFMVWCAHNNVSDIHLQGDNHFVVGRYGRLLRASPFVVADDTLGRLMDEVFSPELRPLVRGGGPVDRAIQLDGDMSGRWGLNRGDRIRFRVPCS
ncbi:plasmid transfer ATPase TraJ, partial [Erwinia sp. OLMDLW33]